MFQELWGASFIAFSSMTGTPISLVKVLSINLNHPIKENVFSKKFVEKYQPKTWAEIQELLNHAR